MFVVTFLTMRTHRFYTPQTLTTGEQIELPKSVSHHCIQVLRYKVNDRLVLFNGNGCDYSATIVQIEGKKVFASIEQGISVKNESPLSIHLYQSIAKGDKMELVIQKCVELGVSQISPIYSERSNVKLDSKRAEKKLASWQNIILSACEQSGRAVIPQINAMQSLKNLSSIKEDSAIFLEPLAQNPISQLSTQQSIALFVGPEGGFSESDLAKIKALGGSGISLGPRILRTETAGLATISILQSTFGDF